MGARPLQAALEEQRELGAAPLSTVIKLGSGNCLHQSGAQTV
jgi:hypothetical protein